MKNHHVPTRWFAMPAAVLLLASSGFANVHVAVTSSPNPARQLETLAVEITVTNSGGSTKNNLSVVFEYPEGLTNLSNSLFDGSCAFDLSGCNGICCPTEQAIINIPTLPPGKGVVFNLPLRVASATLDGTVIPLEIEVYDPVELVASTSTNILVDGGRELELGIAPDRDPIAPGELVTYTLTYGLLATSPGSPNAVLSFSLPSGMTFVSASDGGTFSGGVVEWPLGNLQPGSSGQRRVTVQVNPGVTVGSIITAEASLQDDGANHVTWRSAVRIENQIPLQLVMTASPNPIRHGETMDMELTVTNSGPFDRTDVVLRVEIPDGLGSLSNSLFDGSCPFIISGCNGVCCARETATFSIGTLPAGKGVTFNMPWRIAAATQDGRVITFRGRVTDSTADQRRGGTSIAVRNPNRLELALVGDREPVPPGELVTYTLTYGVPASNPGSAGAMLRLPLPSGTSFVSATGGGALIGDVVEWSLGDLNPGAVGERRVTLQVDGSAVPGTAIFAEAVFQDAALNRVTYQAATRVENDIPLQLVISASPDPIRIGQILHMKLTVTNEGPFDRTGVTLRLDVPDHLASLDNSLFDGSCPWIISGCNGVCCAREKATFNIGTLPAGRGVTYTMPWLVAGSVQDGTVFAFKGEVTDSTADRRRATTSVAVRSAHDVGLTVVQDRNPVTAGERLTYTVSYGLREGAPGSPNAALRFPVPQGTTFVSASDGGVLVDGVVEWALGDLQRRATGERRVAVEVDPGVSAGSIITTEVSFLDAATPPNVVAYETAVKVEPWHPLELAIIASPNPARPGETLDVEITVSNTGEFDRTGIVIRLEVPQHLASLNNSLFGGSCAWIVSGCNGVCCAREKAIFNIDTLPAGTGTTFSMPWRVASSSVDGSVLSFRVEAWDNQSDYRRSGTNLTVNALRALDLALVEASEPVVPGSEVTYTITYGAFEDGGGASGSTLRFLMPEDAAFVSATGGGAVSGNEVVWSIGNVNPGAGGERAVTVQVDPAATLGTILKSHAHFRDSGGKEVRFSETTRVQSQPPLDVQLVAVPHPVMPGMPLELELSVTNTSDLARTGVVLTLEYPDGLNNLSNSLFDGSCPWIISGCNGVCCAQETATFNVGDLAVDETVTFLVPPVVSGSTLKGTIINFDAWGKDATDFLASAGFAVMVGSEFDTGAPSVPGDLNGDGVVNVDDLLIVLNNWGECDDCDDCPADITGNCTVNVDDLLIVLNNWG